MPNFRIVYRSPGVKRGRELAGDMLQIEAANERAARKAARELLSQMFFGQKPVIAWVYECKSTN